MQLLIFFKVLFAAHWKLELEAWLLNSSLLARIANTLPSGKLYLKGMIVSWIFLKSLFQNTHVFLIKSIVSVYIECIFKRILKTASFLQFRSKPVSLRDEATYTEFSSINLKTAENGKFSLVSL